MFWGVFAVLFVEFTYLTGALKREYTKSIDEKNRRRAVHGVTFVCFSFFTWELWKQGENINKWSKRVALCKSSSARFYWFANNQKADCQTNCENLCKNLPKLWWSEIRFVMQFEPAIEINWLVQTVHQIWRERERFQDIRQSSALQSSSTSCQASTWKYREVYRNHSR